MCCSRKTQARGYAQRGRTLRRASNEKDTVSPPMLTPSSSASSLSSKSDHFEEINAEVLNRAGVQPPSYDSVITNEKPIRAYRTSIPDEQPPPLSLDPHMMAKLKLNDARDDLSDADESFNAEVENATEVFVSKRKLRQEQRAAEREEWRQKKGERKAERAAKKAEKYRARAEKWAERAAVRESQYVY